jgi:hypothetical protein
MVHVLQREGQQPLQIQRSPEKPGYDPAIHYGDACSYLPAYSFTPVLNVQETRLKISLHFPVNTWFAGFLQRKKREKPRVKSVTPEFPGFSDIFKFMFIDQDGDNIGIDTQCFYQRAGKLFDHGTFLFKGKSFSHFDDYNGHGSVHRYSGTMC